MIIHEIHMDLVNRGTPWRIDAVQGEQGSRSIRAHLYAAGQPWPVPDDVLVSLRYSKPNHKIGAYSTREDGSAAWVADCNTLTMALEKQVLNVRGTVNADIVLAKADYILATFPFEILVSPSPEGVPDTSGGNVDDATLVQMLTAIKGKGDDLTYDKELKKMFLTSSGVRIGEGVNIESSTAPYIGENGNWWIGETDTGMPSRGENGISPKVTVTETDYGYDMQVSFDTASTVYPIYHGEPGENYTLTEADKQEIAEQAAELVPNDLPAVTTENNGSFLRVVDGNWAVTEIANAEEVSF